MGQFTNQNIQKNLTLSSSKKSTLKNGSKKAPLRSLLKPVIQTKNVKSPTERGAGANRSRGRNPGKQKNRDLLKEQLMMFESLPDEMMRMKNLTEQQLEDTILSLKTALGLSLKGAKSRRKGSTYELRIAKKIKESWKIDLTRTPMSGGFKKSTTSEEFRGDLNTVDKSIRFLLHTECKDHVKWSPKEWMEQAKGDCPEGKYPVIICHQAQEIKDGKRVREADDFIMLRLEDFLHIADITKIIVPKTEELVNV